MPIALSILFYKGTTRAGEALQAAGKDMPFFFAAAQMAVSTDSAHACVPVLSSLILVPSTNSQRGCPPATLSVAAPEAFIQAADVLFVAQAPNCS